MVRERNPSICLFDDGVISLDIDTENLIVIRVSHDQMQKKTKFKRWRWRWGGRSANTIVPVRHRDKREDGESEYVG